MWACDGSLKRHFWGRQSGMPVAVCGYEGKYPLNYVKFDIPRCKKCAGVFPKYRKETQNDNNTTAGADTSPELA